MKKGLPYILFLLVLAGCARKYFVTKAFRNGIPPGMRELELDSSYHFYLREVYKQRNDSNERVMKANLEVNDTANKKRIETEFLLLSWKHRNAVYITCIPDKYQLYYSTFKLPFQAYINAYDFSTFHFGKVNDAGDEIDFVSKGGSSKDTWEIRPGSGKKGDTIAIKTIIEREKGIVENMILVSEALEQPVSFDRIDSFVIVFRKFSRKLEKRGRPPVIRRLKDDKIYFTTNENKYDVYFRFDKYMTGHTDSTILFKNDRIRYSPAPLLDSND